MLYTILSIPLLLYRLCVDFSKTPWILSPGGDPIEGHWSYSIAVCVIVTLLIFKWWKHAAWVHVANLTHLAMFSGLFSSEAIPPLQDDPTWAVRASPEQLAQHVAAQAIANGPSKNPDEVGADCATMYAEQTVAAINGEDAAIFGEPAAGAADPAGLVTALSSIITIVGAAGRLRPSVKGGGEVPLSRSGA